MPTNSETAESSPAPVHDRCSDAITPEWLDALMDGRHKSKGGSTYWDKVVSEDDDGKAWIRIHDPDSWGDYGVEMHSITQCSDGAILGGTLLGMFNQRKPVRILVGLIEEGHQ
ncbi:hypothetical protein [Crateriforma spongiae]|uniref:hypothetical protein n=1 Tax=Crateriforma spongiae TaxID=2724528 RepID=UPI0039AEC0F9